MTCANLDPDKVYLVQILHGEPRSCCAGTFSNNDFLLSTGATLAVSAFVLGNGVQGENPPAALDRAIVEVELRGVTSFTYRMNPADTRDPSVAGFQVRELPGFGNVTASVAPGLPVLRQAAVAWGDYDNDGLLDFLISGYDETIYNGVSQLWRNTGAGFTNVTSTAAPGLLGLSDSFVSWGDFDNDRRLDFAIAGRSEGNLRITQLWRNLGGQFANVTAITAPGLPGVSESPSLAWSDYDNDGRLDFMLIGSNISQLWRNTGNGFTNVTTSVAPGLPGVGDSSLAWGDFNNDTRLDFLIMGKNGNAQSFTQVWRNNGIVTTTIPGDSNGDGLVSQAEFAAVLAALPNELATQNAAGYFTEAQVRSLNVRTPLLSQVSPGRFRLTLGIQRSTNLSANPFIDFSFASPDSSHWINPEGELEFEFPSTDDAAFFRIEAQ